MSDQHTLGATVELAGIGLHTGAAARVRLRPQRAGSGMRFQLVDPNVTFPALAEYIVDTRRATVVGSGGATVSTVEHLLSALFALGVDNASIEVEGPEIPVLDGSSAAFVRAIEQAGLVAQHVPRRTLVVDRPLIFRDGDALLAIAPADTFRIRFAVDFAPPVGAQYIDATVEPDFYAREIAPARTFGYLHEVEALRSAGLARGGSLDNALVFAPEGPLSPLRWQNEVVRHKVLDLIGDFALLGAWPRCDIVSIKSGHRLHAQATHALRVAFVPHLAALGS